MTRHGLALAVIGAIAAAGGAAPAIAACAAPPDVLPVALPKADAAAAVRIGPSSADGTPWMISGVINRCTDGDTFMLVFPTPAAMGITRSAAIEMSVSGATLKFGNEAVENNPTEWTLTSQPSIAVADAANADPAKNVLKVTWSGTFSNLTEYQLHYTIFLVQQ